MKQKVVIRVQMESAKKRSKAMKVVVGVPGVLSAAIEGADKSHIVVVGEGVDSVTLTRSLRKNMGSAELVSVATVDEKKDEKKKTESSVQPLVVWPSYTTPQYHYVNDAQSHYEDPSCCIM